MKKANLHKVVAETISVLLGPHVFGPTIALVVVFRTGLLPEQIKILLPLLLLFVIVIPMGYIHFLRWQGKLSSWDMTLREERPKVISVGLVSLMFALLAVYLFGNQLLLHLMLILVVLGLMSLVITKFWKISLHAGLNSAGWIVINFLFGWKFPFLYLAIPLVLWARYVLKKHTLSQLIAGTILGAIITLGLLFIFGYINFKY